MSFIHTTPTIIRPSGLNRSATAEFSSPIKPTSPSFESNQQNQQNNQQQKTFVRLEGEFDSLLTTTIGIPSDTINQVLHDHQRQLHNDINDDNNTLPLDQTQQQPQQPQQKKTVMVRPYQTFAESLLTSSYSKIRNNVFPFLRSLSDDTVQFFTKATLGSHLVTENRLNQPQLYYQHLTFNALYPQLLELCLPSPLRYRKGQNDRRCISWNQIYNSAWYEFHPPTNPTSPVQLQQLVPNTQIQQITTNQINSPSFVPLYGGDLSYPFSPTTNNQQKQSKPQQQSFSALIMPTFDDTIAFEDFEPGAFFSAVFSANSAVSTTNNSLSRQDTYNNMNYNPNLSFFIPISILTPWQQQTLQQLISSNSFNNNDTPLISEHSTNTTLSLSIPQRISAPNQATISLSSKNNDTTATTTPTTSIYYWDKSISMNNHNLSHVLQLPQYPPIAHKGQNRTVLGQFGMVSGLGVEQNVGYNAGGEGTGGNEQGSFLRGVTDISQIPLITPETAESLYFNQLSSDEQEHLNNFIEKSIQRMRRNHQKQINSLVANGTVRPIEIDHEKNSNIIKDLFNDGVNGDNYISNHNIFIDLTKTQLDSTSQSHPFFLQYSRYYQILDQQRQEIVQFRKDTICNYLLDKVEAIFPDFSKKSLPPPQYVVTDNGEYFPSESQIKFKLINPNTTYQQPSNELGLTVSREQLFFFYIFNFGHSLSQQDISILNRDQLQLYKDQLQMYSSLFESLLNYFMLESTFLNPQIINLITSIIYIWFESVSTNTANATVLSPYITGWIKKLFNQVLGSHNFQQFFTIPFTSTRKLFPPSSTLTPPKPQSRTSTISRQQQLDQQQLYDSQSSNNYHTPTHNIYGVPNPSFQSAIALNTSFSGTDPFDLFADTHILPTNHYGHTTTSPSSLPPPILLSPNNSAIITNATNTGAVTLFFDSDTYFKPLPQGLSARSSHIPPFISSPLLPLLAYHSMYQSNQSNTSLLQNNKISSALLSSLSLDTYGPQTQSSSTHTDALLSQLHSIVKGQNNSIIQPQSVFLDELNTLLLQHSTALLSQVNFDLLITIYTYPYTSVTFNPTSAVSALLTSSNQYSVSNSFHQGRIALDNFMHSAQAGYGVPSSQQANMLLYLPNYFQKQFILHTQYQRYQFNQLFGYDHRVYNMFSNNQKMMLYKHSESFLKQLKLLQTQHKETAKVLASLLSRQSQPMALLWSMLAFTNQSASLNTNVGGNPQSPSGGVDISSLYTQLSSGQLTQLATVEPTQHNYVPLATMLFMKPFYHLLISQLHTISIRSPQLLKQRTATQSSPNIIIEHLDTLLSTWWGIIQPWFYPKSFLQRVKRHRLKNPKAEPIPIPDNYMMTDPVPYHYAPYVISLLPMYTQIPLQLMQQTIMKMTFNQHYKTGIDHTFLTLALLHNYYNGKYCDTKLNSTNPMVDLVHEKFFLDKIDNISQPIEPLLHTYITYLTSTLTLLWSHADLRMMIRHWERRWALANPIDFNQGGKVIISQQSNINPNVTSASIAGQGGDINVNNTHFNKNLLHTLFIDMFSESQNGPVKTTNAIDANPSATTITTTNPIKHKHAHFGYFCCDAPPTQAESKEVNYDSTDDNGAIVPTEDFGCNNGFNFSYCAHCPLYDDSELALAAGNTTATSPVSAGASNTTFNSHISSLQHDTSLNMTTTGSKLDLLKMYKYGFDHFNRYDYYTNHRSSTVKLNMLTWIRDCIMVSNGNDGKEIIDNSNSNNNQASGDLQQAQVNTNNGVNIVELKLVGIFNTVMNALNQYTQKRQHGDGGRANRSSKMFNPQPNIQSSTQTQPTFNQTKVRITPFNNARVALAKMNGNVSNNANNNNSSQTNQSNSLLSQLVNQDNDYTNQIPIPEPNHLKLAEQYFIQTHLFQFCTQNSNGVAIDSPDNIPTQQNIKSSYQPLFNPLPLTYEQYLHWKDYYINTVPNVAMVNFLDEMFKTTNQALILRERLVLLQVYTLTLNSYQNYLIRLQHKVKEARSHGIDVDDINFRDKLKKDFVSPFSFPISPSDDISTDDSLVASNISIYDSLAQRFDISKHCDEQMKQQFEENRSLIRTCDELITYLEAFYSLPSIDINDILMRYVAEHQTIIDVSQFFTVATIDENDGQVDQFGQGNIAPLANDTLVWNGNDDDDDVNNQGSVNTTATPQKGGNMLFATPAKDRKFPNAFNTPNANTVHPFNSPGSISMGGFFSALKQKKIYRSNMIQLQQNNNNNINFGGNNGALTGNNNSNYNDMNMPQSPHRFNNDGLNSTQLSTCSVAVQPIIPIQPAHNRPTTQNIFKHKQIKSTHPTPLQALKKMLSSAQAKLFLAAIIAIISFYLVKKKF